MAANGPLWTIMDERDSCEYRLFPLFEDEDEEEGIGRPVLTDVAVMEAAHLDDEGEVLRRDSGPAARRYDERAWELLQQDRGLRELMEATASSIAAVGVKASSSADGAQAAMLESLRDLLQRRRTSRGRRDVS